MVYNWFSKQNWKTWFTNHCGGVCSLAWRDLADHNSTCCLEAFPPLETGVVSRQNMKMDKQLLKLVCLYFGLGFQAMISESYGLPWCLNWDCANYPKKKPGVRKIRWGLILELKSMRLMFYRKETCYTLRICDPLMQCLGGKLENYRGHCSFLLPDLAA